MIRSIIYRMFCAMAGICPKHWKPKQWQPAGPHSDDDEFVCYKCERGDD